MRRARRLERICGRRKGGEWFVEGLDFLEYVGLCCVIETGMNGRK